MALSYLLHTFNGLDIRYSTPYVKNLKDRSVILALMQYTLVYVAAAIVVGLVAIVATWIPARAATRVDPAVALRLD